MERIFLAGSGSGSGDRPSSILVRGVRETEGLAGGGRRASCEVRGIRVGRLGSSHAGYPLHDVKQVTVIPGRGWRALGIGRASAGLISRRPLRVAGFGRRWDCRGQSDLQEEIVSHSELAINVVLAAIRDHEFAAYDVLVKEYPSEAVIAAFTDAARSGFTSFGVAVHLASLTDKGRERLKS